MRWFRRQPVMTGTDEEDDAIADAVRYAEYESESESDPLETVEEVLDAIAFEADGPTAEQLFAAMQDVDDRKQVTDARYAEADAAFVRAVAMEDEVRDALHTFTAPNIADLAPLGTAERVRQLRQRQDEVNLQYQEASLARRAAVVQQAASE